MGSWVQSSEAWKSLCQVAIKGAEYDSPERRPHPKCLQQTRVNFLRHTYDLLDAQGKNKMVWVHGTAGVGKSAVAFTVAERMRDTEMGEKAFGKNRLAGTFFFSRKYTERCTTVYFFATLAYQLARKFSSIKCDLSMAIHEDSSVLDPKTSLRDQMETLFLRPLRRLKVTLCDCPPLIFVVDALDECTSKAEIIDLISLLGKALRDSGLPAVYIFLTSRSEAHIHKAMDEDDLRPFVCKIPVEISGELISLDGADVDSDIYKFLKHSFTDKQQLRDDFPQPSERDLERLANRAGRRFIVASTMMNFIDDGYNDPCDRLRLMLELTNKLLPGTEVHKLYDQILLTCAKPERAYLHLSVVAALANPLPIAQISELLGPGQGSDVKEVLAQLRSVMDIPTDSSLPVNIYHSSVRHYVLESSRWSLFKEQIMTQTQMQTPPPPPTPPPPHTLLAHSSLHLMMNEIPECTDLLNALVELKTQSQALVSESHAHEDLRASLAFLVEPPTGLGVFTALLWLEENHNPQLQPWLKTLDGRAWLRTQAGSDWLETPGGMRWLQKQAGLDWLESQGGKGWLESVSGRRWLESSSAREWLESPGGRNWLRSPDGSDWLELPSGRHWLKSLSGWHWLQSPSALGWLHSRSGREWLQSLNGEEWLKSWGGNDWLHSGSGRDWEVNETCFQLSLSGQEWLQTLSGRRWLLQAPGGQEWLQAPGRQEWLQTPGGRRWLQTRDGEEWLQTRGGEEWLQTRGGEEWLQAPGGQAWLEAYGGHEWLQAPGGHEWLQANGGQEWLQAPAGQEWLQIPAGQEWLQAPDGEEWLQTPGGQEWLKEASGGQKWLEVPGGQEWLEAPGGQEWLQDPSGVEWLQTQSALEWLQSRDQPMWLQIPDWQRWLQTPNARKWLQTKGGIAWIQSKSGQGWLLTQSGREWLQAESGLAWLQTHSGQEWLKTQDGRDSWLQTHMGQEWLPTQCGQKWLQSPSARIWLQTPSARNWLQTQDGRNWLQMPHGQAWQSTAAASFWVHMEEFFNTREAISELTLTPAMSLLPAYQVLQQLVNLPDFLIFPVFLMLTPTCATSSLADGPDMEIIHAMNAFLSFANEARERSHLTSGSLKYACRNWVMHLSQAPDPLDDSLRHIFKVFWEAHLLCWLERQWCLRSLQSCLDVLSEGRELAERHLTDTSLSPIG